VQADVSKRVDVVQLFDAKVVSLGPTDGELFSQGRTEQDEQGFAQLAALGRLEHPQDIADVVATLCTEDARWTTGQNVRANSGTI
jgi:3-oxoacyl-[acyl-carrier protein] reductase